MLNRLGVGAVDKTARFGGICDYFLQLAKGGSCGIQPEILLILPFLSLIANPSIFD
jgi:hypothetical protein